MKFQTGKTYTSNESTSIQFRVVKLTKCFATVETIVDGAADSMFIGTGRRKIQVINGKEYFDAGIYSCYAQ